MYFFDEPEFQAVFSSIESILTDTNGREPYFLSPEEALRWHKIRPDRQRRSWLAGRICLKFLWYRFNQENQDKSVDENSISWSTINVSSWNEHGEGVSPVLYVDGNRIDRHFSLSHSDFSVLAVLSKQKDRRIGCDLVPLGSFSHRINPFIFHPAEQKMIDGTTEETADRIWAVKEAVYKATSTDRPFAPLQWHVERLNDDIFICRSSESSVVVSTWRHDDHALAVTVVDVSEAGQQ